MKRTTIMLPDDVLARLRHESRRRGTSVAEIVREAVELHVGERPAGKRLSFFAVGEGGPADASERVDEYVDAAVRKRGRRDG
jgi:hypothetical protein